MIDVSENVEADISFEGSEFKMYCNRHQDVVSEHIISSGAWEADITRDIALALKTAAEQRKLQAPATGMFLDIGANIGWHSLAVAAAGYRVVGFVPVTHNERLQRSSICANIGFSNRMTLHSVMLGNETSGNCRVFSDNANKGNGIVRCDPQYQPPTVYSLLTSDAKLMMLDDFADSFQDVLVLKMDVEGHEPFVFAGGRAVFLNLHIPYIIMEWDWPLMREKRFSNNEILAVLQSFEKAGYALKTHSFRGATWTSEQVQALGSAVDLFLVHSDVEGLM